MTANTWPHTLTTLAATHPGVRLTLTAVAGFGWIAELRVKGVGTYASTAHEDMGAAIGRVLEMWGEVGGAAEERK